MGASDGATLSGNLCSALLSFSCSVRLLFAPCSNARQHRRAQPCRPRRRTRRESRHHRRRAFRCCLQADPWQQAAAAALGEPWTLERMAIIESARQIPRQRRTHKPYETKRRTSVRKQRKRGRGWRWGEGGEDGGRRRRKGRRGRRGKWGSNGRERKVENETRSKITIS